MPPPPGPSADDLLPVLAQEARGPRRDGLLALWLVLRVLADLTGPPLADERAQRRRLQALDGRLQALTLPPALRRALAGTLAQLRLPTADAARLALALLVAPVQEALGPAAARVVRATLDAAAAPAH